LTVDRAKLRLIGRGDLLAALDRAVAKKVTIISASAGSGKTSLLRTWADRPGQPHRLAVVQVQRDQHDAQQFWLALLSAVRHASGTAGLREPPAAAPDFNGRAMAGRVLSELADQRGRLILIIDDLHELASPDAISQLTRLLTNPGRVARTGVGWSVADARPAGRDHPRLAPAARSVTSVTPVRASDLRCAARPVRLLGCGQPASRPVRGKYSHAAVTAPAASPWPRRA
jgi:AAA ATPase domain